jgi:hypothetical protein
MASQKGLPKSQVGESSSYLMTADTEMGKAELEGLALSQIRKTTAKKPYPHRLKVSFRDLKACNQFAKLIQKDVNATDKEITFTPPNPDATGSWSFFKNKRGKKQSLGISKFHAAHWKGMPSFDQEQSQWTYHSLTMVFKNAKDYATFATLVRQYLTEKQKSIYYPVWTPEKVRYKKWVSTLPREQITPRYPIYIISKGRAFSRLTSKTLDAMNVPYYMVIEPAEYDSYASVIDPQRILTLPYDSDPKNPTGPGRARNWCRDHSWEGGFNRHWVLDDNIDGFYRLHNNKRYRVADGAIFCAAEDFVDRYENIWVAGFQYRFFCAQKSKYPPFVANTRIYSCLLIDNRRIFELDGHEFLWRERYNEDTILSLDVLENKFCTVQFNAFLQGKIATQTRKGGNTEVFYEIEGSSDLKAAKTSNYNPGGTINKTLTLTNLYPHVAKAVQKYGRIHHEVDYSRYKENQLLLLDGIEPDTEPNDYGMTLVTMTAAEIRAEKQIEQNRGVA